MTTCHSALRRSAPVVAAAIAIVLAAAPPAAAQAPAQFFRQNCAACHTIGGGRITGPDLKDVSARRDRAWLARFIQNPQAVIDSGDPYARDLVSQARGVVMPMLPGLNQAMAEALLDLIDAESKLERSQFVGLQLSTRPFTPADVARGHGLFTGESRLANSGPPCLSCHSVGGVGALGGGKLGPDLTLVYERLQGRKGLGTWLSAPATPTMQTVFKATPLASEELDPLLAFFEDASRRRSIADPVAPLAFFLLGLGGAAFGVVVFDVAWHGRFRGVRRRLIEAVSQRGVQ